MTEENHASTENSYKDSSISDQRFPKKRRIKDLKEKIIYLEKKLEEEIKKSDDYLTRSKYLQADYENYVKRVKKDAEEQIRFANEKLILSLIDVLESLEKAVEIGNSHDNTSIKGGVEMVLKELYNLLKKEGLSEIDAVGKSFDPYKHEAVGQIDAEEDEGKVIREIRKGYILNEKLLRPSMVEVARKKSSNNQINLKKVTKDE